VEHAFDAQAACILGPCLSLFLTGARDLYLPARWGGSAPFMAETAPSSRATCDGLACQNDQVFEGDEDCLQRSSNWTREEVDRAALLLDPAVTPIVHVKATFMRLTDFKG
jgi:hypothetical protein